MFSWDDYWKDEKFGRENWGENGSGGCLVGGENRGEIYSLFNVIRT